jgi:hypothetical protein
MRRAAEITAYVVNGSCFCLATLSIVRGRQCDHNYFEMLKKFFQLSPGDQLKCKEKFEQELQKQVDYRDYHSHVYRIKYPSPEVSWDWVPNPEEKT